MMFPACSLNQLIDRIVTDHHGFLRRHLPVLVRLVDSAAPREARRLMDRFTTELEEHIFREEQILFPALRELESAGRRLPLADAVRQMGDEHELVRQQLAEIRRSVEELPDAQELKMALAELEADLRRHLNLEECVLFPRAQALLASSPQAWPCALDGPHATSRRLGQRQS